ncbi:Endonuclease I [uncultured Mediterranean phage uvMED]|nr:Endonuclease I [uncultured Mediterranean phage uvMED]
MIVLTDSTDAQELKFIPRGYVADTIVVTEEETNKSHTFKPTFDKDSYYLKSSLVFDSSTLPLREDKFYNFVVSLDDVPISVDTPTAPSNVVVSNITGTRATVTWDASTDDNGIGGYNVYLDDVLQDTVTTLVFYLENLSQLTTYNLKIEPFDTLNNIGVSTLTTFTTADTENPTDPTNLVASNITDTSFDLSFTGSTDNNYTVTYCIYQDDVKIAEISDLTYSFTGLTTEITYKIGVRAKDSAGNYSNTTNINVTTASVQQDTLFSLFKTRAEAEGFTVEDHSCINTGETAGGGGSASGGGYESTTTTNNASTNEGGSQGTNTTDSNVIDTSFADGAKLGVLYRGRIFVTNQTDYSINNGKYTQNNSDNDYITL